MLLFNLSLYAGARTYMAISIHLMLLFNEKVIVQLIIHYNFNTSNVTIQQELLEIKLISNLFQYI